MKATDTLDNSSHCSSVHTTSKNSHIILFFSSHIFRTKADWNLPKEMDDFRHWANIKDPVFDEWCKTDSSGKSGLRQEDAGGKLYSVKRQVTLAQMWGCVLYFERRERNKINQSRKFLVRAMVCSVRICMHCLTFSTRVIFYVPFKREIYCPLSSGSRTLTIINILEKKFKTPAIWLLRCWWKQRELRTLNSSSLSA